MFPPFFIWVWAFFFSQKFVLWPFIRTTAVGPLIINRVIFGSWMRTIMITELLT